MKFWATREDWGGTGYEEKQKKKCDFILEGGGKKKKISILSTSHLVVNLMENFSKHLKNKNIWSK